MIFIHDKSLVDYLLNLFIILVMLIHAWAVFGNNWLNRLLVMAMIFFLSVVKYYFGYYLLRNMCHL